MPLAYQAAVPGVRSLPKHMLLMPLKRLGMRQSNFTLRLMQRLAVQRQHLELANIRPPDEGIDPLRTRINTKENAAPYDR